MYFFHKSTHIINVSIINSFIKRTEGRSTENYLLEFKTARIRLNKVREIKSREFKISATRILIQVRYDTKWFLCMDYRCVCSLFSKNMMLLRQLF